MARTITPASERIWTRVDKTSTCWNWTGCLDRKGYGIIGDKTGDQKVSLRVHRLAYSLLIGPLTDEDQVDHRCHNRHCVNPEHLRATTGKQNQENRAGARRDSSSGIRGVYASGDRWTAEVRHCGQKNHIGTFDSAQEAEAAAIAKRNELFTHNDIDRMA